MKCCICKKECENQWGNNPWPISTKKDDRCCNQCNVDYVIPARIILSNENKKGEKENE